MVKVGTKACIILTNKVMYLTFYNHFYYEMKMNRNDGVLLFWLYPLEWGGAFSATETLVINKINNAGSNSQNEMSWKLESESEWQHIFAYLMILTLTMLHLLLNILLS